MIPQGNLKRWSLLPQREHFCTQGLLETLLEARGVAPQSRDSFLHPKYEDLYDPFLFQDMRKACQRIFNAITHKEKITNIRGIQSDSKGNIWAGYRNGLILIKKTKLENWLYDASLKTGLIQVLHGIINQW